MRTNASSAIITIGNYDNINIHDSYNNITITNDSNQTACYYYNIHYYYHVLCYFYHWCRDLNRIQYGVFGNLPVKYMNTLVLRAKEKKKLTELTLCITY